MGALAGSLALPLGGSGSSGPSEDPAVTRYADVLRKLFPPGRLWNWDIGSLLNALNLAAASELARISARGRDLIEEADPRTATETLPEYEEMLSAPSTGTLEQRRARVSSLLLRRKRFRPADFREALAAVLVQDAEDVVIIERSRAFAVSVGDDREIYRFFVYRDPSIPGDYDIAAAQDIVDKMKPEHTAGFVIEGLSMLCDDPQSLCDRDFLGV